MTWFKRKEARQLDTLVDSLMEIIRLFQSNHEVFRVPLPGIEDNTYRLLTEAAVYVVCIIELGALAFSKEPDPSLDADRLTIKWLNRFIDSYKVIDPETGIESPEDFAWLARRARTVYREYADVFVAAIDSQADTDNQLMHVRELALRFYANVIDDKADAHSASRVMLRGPLFFAISLEVFKGVKNMV